MSGLPWVRFDTAMPDNPKILDLVGQEGGKAAGFVYCCGIAYAGKQGTDGFIPRAALPRCNGDPADAALLMAAELWQEAPGGFLIPGWSERQPTADSQAKTRAAKRAASVKGNCVRHHGEDCGCWREDPPWPRAVPD